MSYSDHDHVNFEQDHELDFILRKYGMERSQQNRNVLKEIGKICREKHGKSILTHKEFYGCVEAHKHKLTPFTKPKPSGPSI